MREVIDRLVERVLVTERASVEAACMRVVMAIGVEGVRTRAVLETEDPPIDVSQIDFSAAVGVGRSRRYTLRVDGAPVWTGGWSRSATQGDRWESRWLVDPERLGFEPQ